MPLFIHGNEPARASKLSYPGQHGAYGVLKARPLIAHAGRYVVPHHQPDEIFAGTGCSS